MKAEQMQLVNIGEVKPNNHNPRLIKDHKFKQLVTSIKEFPEMLKLRPIVVNKDFKVLGGNMRLRACVEAKLQKVWVLRAAGLTSEQEKEFIVKDNVGFGEWDWDILANEWDSVKIESWGIDNWINVDDKEDYDMGGDESKTVNLECVTWQGNKIPITQKEADHLTNLLNKYVDQYSISTGFISSLKLEL